jgi:predicted alpha/beta-hydrolase family hydrolase
MNSPFLSHVHRALAERGVMTVKFNFPYKEQGRKAPDRAPVLEETWRAVAEAVRDEPRLSPRRLFFAGKSMGGRIASHLAAQGQSCSGLVFLGYPLHPPNKPDRLRADHLKAIQCPMLFIQGTRDALCDLDLLRTALEPLQAPVTLRVIEGGDHSFKVLKRLGRSQEAVWEGIIAEIDHWLRA